MPKEIEIIPNSMVIRMISSEQLSLIINQALRDNTEIFFIGGDKKDGLTLLSDK